MGERLNGLKAYTVILCDFQAVLSWIYADPTVGCAEAFYYENVSFITT